MPISPIPELVSELAAGRMVVLVDEEDRENEGDLILAAEHVTPEAINFMARFGRGLICLTLTRERCEHLRLPPMAPRNGTRHGTAFTVSIEAAEGISTGISAADRAHTVRTAVARDAKPGDLVQPGHVFPLQAQDGGVLMRAGHTEAGCDLARMAGLAPAAVICEIMNDDGTMARLPQLEVFCRNHGLKMGTIADLIQHRSRHETLVERMHRRALLTPFGEFEAHAYQDRTGQIHLALTKGRWGDADEVLVRVHEPLSPLDLLDTTAQRHSWALPAALAALQAAERGVAVLLNGGQDGAALLAEFSGRGGSAAQAAAVDLRTYGVGSQILRDLRIGIVQARFNETITDRLAAACRAELLQLGVAEKHIEHVRVPGALEVPIALQALADSEHFDALVALGCVIRGETYHFELVANESGAGVTRVALDHGVPIANAILTVDTPTQAEARADEKGRDAARVAIEMANLMEDLS